MWRRVASGLKSGHQLTIATILRKLLLPKSVYRDKIREGDQAKKEMWRCLGSLELLPVEMKTAVGALLLARGNKLEPFEFWVIARLGARHMFHAPGNFVLPSNTANHWVNQLMTFKLSNPIKNPLLFAITRLASVTGDRGNDLPSTTLDYAHEYLKKYNCLEGWAEHLRRKTSDSVEETEKVLADSLPLGLSLIEPNT